MCIWPRDFTFISLPCHCLPLPPRPSQALLNPVALDFPSLDSPQAWLSAIGLECYRDNFSQSGLCTFGDVAQLSLE